MGESILKETPKGTTSCYCVTQVWQLRINTGSTNFNKLWLRLPFTVRKGINILNGKVNIRELPVHHNLMCHITKNVIY